MKVCWASNFGDCKGKISREHFVSHALLESVIYTKNYIQDKEVNVGKGYLTVKYLCKKHNEDLSKFDSESTKVRDKIFYPHANLYKINGSLFEKWLIKMVVGYCHAKHLNISNEEYIKKVLFFGKTMKSPLGFYFLTNNKNEGLFHEAITLIPIQNADRQIVSFLLRMWGLKFFIMLEKIEGFENRKNFSLDADFRYLNEYDTIETWSNLTPFYRPNGIKIKNINLEFYYT